MAAAQAVAFLGVAISTEIGGDDGAYPWSIGHCLHIAIPPRLQIRLGIDSLALPRRSQLSQYADQRRRSRDRDGLAVQLNCRADNSNWHSLPPLGPVPSLRNSQRSLHANSVLSYRRDRW